MFIIYALIAVAVFALPLGYVAYRLNLITKANVVYLLISHALLALGLVLIIKAGYRFAEYEHQKEWPVLDALVDNTMVKGNRAIRPQIYYLYTFAGRSFRDSTNLGTPGFGGRNSRRQTARNIIKEYRQGDTLTVHVNPDNASESYVRIKPAWNVYMQYGLGISFSAIAVAFIGCAVSQRVSRKRQKGK